MKEYKNRLIIATLILAQALLILSGRLWYMQILKGNEYEKFSSENRIRITRFSAPRGRILDRRGRELVVNRSSFDVYVYPNDITNTDAISIGLSHILGLDASEIKKKIQEGYKENRFSPTLIDKDINRDQLAFIEARRILFLEYSSKLITLENTLMEKSVLLLLATWGKQLKMILNRIQTCSPTSWLVKMV